MAFDNIVIPDELQGSYLQDPSLSLPTPQNIGLTDLLLPNLGAPASQTPVNPIQESLDLFESKPASAQTMAAPKFFDYDATQADRYVNSKYFGQLGFDPGLGQENEYKYGALQTWGDVWSNGLTGMFKLAGNTYVEGWKGWGNLADALTTLDSSKLVGTPEELLEQDKATKDIMNKYAIFSTPESEEGIFNRKFFGDMLQQSGFAVGAIGQFLSEELLTFGLSTEFSLAKLGIKAPSWAGKVVTKADLAADMVKLGNPVWKSKSIGEGLVQTARQIIPFADTAYTMNKYGKAGAGALQIASIGLGGLRRTLSEANMAFTEARMEAAGTYGELYNKLYDEELNRTGEAPSAEKLEAMKQSAMNAAQDNFTVNSGILMLSNRLQFDNVFSKFGLGRNVFGAAGEYADDVLKVTGRKGGQEAVEDLTKIYAKGRLGTMGILGDIAKDFGKRKAAWEATKSFGRNIFKWETSEGLQELLQEGSNIALTDYYYDLYHGVKGADFTKYVEKAASEQYTNQGLKTFLMGALTGRLLSPINFVAGQAKYYGGTTQAQRKNREADIIESVNTINAFYTNPKLFLNEHIANVKVQDKAAKNMEEAIKNRDKYEYSNNKDGAFAKLMSTAMKTDMFKAVTDTIREYGNTLDDTQFKEAFGIDRTEENVASVKDFFNTIADESESFQKTWKSLKDKYGDSVLVDIYKEGTPERETALMAKKVLDDAIEILATNSYKARRNAERATTIQNEVAAIPVFGASASTGFRVAGVIENTEKELDLLKREIENLESGEKLDRSAKDLLKAKKLQLKALTMWNDNYEALEKKGVKEKRKFKKAMSAFAAYINAKNTESGISQEIKIDDVQEIYEKLVDYIQLNKDSKDYIDAYNVLANPINFVKTHRRLLDAADEARKKLNAEHLQEALAALENKNPQDKKIKTDDKDAPPAFDKYMTDAYDSQKDAGSTDLPYDEWLKTPVASTFAELYNKKYGTSETLDQKKADLKSRLLTLKNEVLTSDLTPDVMNDVFNKFAELLNIPKDDVYKLYEEFQNTLDPKELENKLIEAGLRRTSSEDEIFKTISKTVLPMFIDDLIKEKTSDKDKKGNIIDPKDNHEIIELPSLKINMNKPTLKPGEKLVDNGKLGVFIIDAGKEGFLLVTSDRTDPFGSTLTVSYITKVDAESGRDKAIAERDAQFKKDRSYFPFDGQEIRAGLVMVRKSDGKRFVVTNKGEAFVPRDKDGNVKKDENGNDILPSIKLRLLRNRTSTDTAIIVTNLNDFEIKKKVEVKDSGEPVDNSVFRLFRNDELSRIYPHVDRVAGETQEAAQKRLDDFLKNTPPAEFAAGVTIKIKENPGVRSEKQAGGKGEGGKKPNPSLIQLGEKYQIQLLFKGQPIGYLTNFDHFRVLSEGGFPVPIPNLTLNQFRMIFDSKDKDAWNQMQQFKSNYEQSRKVQAALAKFVKPGQEVEISSEELSKILKFNVSSGEFDFIDNGISYLELPYNTINGFYYIIDRSRRYTKGYNFKVGSIAITNARGEDLKKIEKEIELAKATTDPTEQLGRYVVVAKLPNGNIKFLELKTDTLPADQFNEFITQINERSKITKEQNTEVGLNDKKEKTPIRKKLDFNETLNSELASKLFISVPQEQKGTYIIFSLSDTGNLELVFLKKVGDQDVKRKITLSGKTLFDPVEFKDINDLIAQINKKIEEHDKNEAVANVAKLQIGFKLTRENFKQSTPDVSRYEDVKLLKTDVSPDMVKNIRLTIKAVDQIVPVTPPQSSASNPTSNPPGNPVPVSSKANDLNNGGVPIDPVMQAEFFKAMGITPPAQGGTDPSQMSPVQKLYKDLDNLKRDKELEAVKIREEKIASGMRAAQAIREANDEASIKFDKKIKELQTRINEEKNNARGSALKVVNKPNFDQMSVINIDKFKRYVNKILGDNVSVQEIEVMIDRLKQNNITVGRFVAYLDQVQDGAPKVKGRIEVGADSPFKYHEAFHAVFRLMLTDDQIQKYLGYAKLEVKKSLEEKKTTLKAELDKMRQLHTLYAGMTDAELEERYYEEYLADRFDAWKINQDAKVLPGIRGFFQKLWNFITSLFKRFSKGDIEGLFKEIDRGKYKNSKIRQNRFTKPDALSVNEPALKAIQVGTIDVQDENGMYITIPKYLPQREGDKIVSTVASMFHTRALSMVKHNKKEVLNSIFDDFIDLYAPNGSRASFYDDEIQKLYEEDPALAEEYAKKLDERFLIFSEKANRDELVKAVESHLQLMGFKQELESDEYEAMEDEFGSRVTTDNWKETHSIGGFGSLSKFLRQYIATTTYVVDKDEFGNTQFVNGEPLIEAVDANTVYNGVLKAVSNITDQRKFVNRLLQMKSDNTETSKFLDKFFEDVDLEIDEKTGNFIIHNTKQATLFQMVLKGFQQYTVDYIFNNKDIRKDKKISVLMLANRMGAAKAQFTQWQNAYVNVFQNPLLRIRDKKEQEEFVKSKVATLQDLFSDLDPEEYISDEDLEARAQAYSNGLKQELGISLSPLYIKFSIASSKKLQTESQRKLTELFDEADPISSEDVQQIIKSVLALENPFSKNIDSLKQESAVVVGDEEEEQKADADDLGEGGNITRINNMARNNAIFDETVNTTSYKNADGELVYAHQLPTFHLVRTMDFNDQDVLNSLREDDFLADNFLLDSEEFQAMVGDFKILRQDGMKASILSENEDGDHREDKTIASNQNKGITYGSYSDREFLISLMDLYKYNQEYNTGTKKFLTSQHLIRVIEASNTGDTIALPILKAVQTNEKGETTLSPLAVGILAKEVAREFERIRKVRNEIATGVYPEGEIEGYHYAVDGNDQRTNDVPRGLKFYKTRNMLGELASELEALSKDLNFDISTKAADIAAQIQSYWGEKMDEIVDISGKLGIVTIGKDQGGNEEITNNLVDDFIHQGFTSKSDNKIISDERTNDMANLMPGNIRHNLAQMMMNDFINTLTFNQLLYGDEAKAFKDEIDQVKRAKGANGSGPSLESYVINPELGITQAFTESYMLTFTDPKFKANYSGGLGKKADAQSYFTVKGARYTLHGLGQLTPQIAAILDKLEAGIPLTEDEIFNKDGGLKAVEGMLNSKKLVYFDGPQYIKTSTVILTKEFTSQKVDGAYVSRIGYEELHNLRERMEKFELEKNTVTFAAPKSASKGVKKNVFDHTLGFKSATDNNFVRQETKYWRLQLVNPSNKIEITDPTQAKQVIASQQDDGLIVNFRGTNVSVGDLKKMYFKDTAQRLDNNYSRNRDDIFDIDEAFRELGKSIEQDKISPKLAKFQKQATKTLMATGADSQLLEFFSLDEETGKPKYNLNNSVTLDKFTQLFLAYFSKGVMSEKVPGHSVALMSNYGVKVVKRFTGRFDENGVPIGEVIPRAVVEQDYDTYKNAKRWNNDIDRQFSGLNPGDFYVDDLRHNVPEYDANGKIIGRYTEFMMPPHFKEDMRLKPGEKIPDHILKAFGVRIPTDDFHSFISLKLVDFMPAYYGSTAVFAHELIEISGADFDIDKLYMQIYDTYVKGDKRVPYGTETSQEGKFYEFVRWNYDNNKSFKQTLKELKASDPAYQKAVNKLENLKDLQKAFKELFDKIPESEKSIREGMQSAILISRLIDNYIADLKDITEDVYREKLGTVEEAYFAQDLEEMLSKFDAREIAWAERNYGFEMADVLRASLPKIKEINNEILDAETVLISAALKEQKLPSNIIDYNKAIKTRELNNGILNNRILEEKLTFLNNEHVTKGGAKAIAFEVSSVKLLSDLLNPKVPGNLFELLSDEDGNLPESIANIIVEGGNDTDSYIGKYKAFKNNKEGSRGIGPAVNSMLTYSVFNTFGIKLRDTYVDPKTGKTEKMYKFKLNGHEFDGYDHSSSFNFETGEYDGDNRIFSIIATIVTAMTDNAKERLAARLGLNVEAIGYVSNLVAQGVPLDAAVVFMLQPVVREYFELTKIASNGIKTGAESEIYKSQVAKALYEKYRKEAGDDYVKADLTDEMLLNNIMDEGSSAIYQASIMDEFMGVIEQSGYYSAVSQVLKLTKGLGTSFEDYDAINEKIEMLGLRVKDDGKFESFIPEGQKTPPPFDIRQIIMGYDASKPQHEFMSKYIKVADQINEISKGVLIERTAPFKQLENIVKDNLNVKMSIRKKFNTDLKRDLISYLSIKAYRKYLAENGRAGTLSTMTNAMIYDEAAEAKGENFMDIIDTIRIIREKLPNNYLTQYFLNAVSTTIVDNENNAALNPKNRDGINKLETNTWAKLSEAQVEKLRDSFIEIYQSDLDYGNGRNGRDMANALFNYLLVKDGGQFRSGSFIRYIPNFMFTDLLASTGKANEIMKLKRTPETSQAIDEEYRKVFGMTALEMSNEFMEMYTTHVGNSPYVKIIKMKNAPKFEKSGNTEVDNFEPSSITYTKDGGISIDIFRAVRKGKSTKPMTLEEEAGAVFMDDAEYYEFIGGLSDEQKAEAEEAKTKSSKYSSDEKAKFAKNMQDLEAKGFYKNKKGQVVFPYIIKVKSGEMFVEDGYYILRTVKKAKVKGKVAPGVDEKRLIQAGETIASGVGAYYELIKRNGSPKTFKAAAVFDAIPEVGKLRKYRKSTNNSLDYNPFYQTSSDDPIKEENWYLRNNIPVPPEVLARSKKVQEDGKKVLTTNPVSKPMDIGTRTPKDILAQYGITMQFVAGKGIVYGGEYDNIIPEDVRKTLHTPMDILQALGYTPDTAAPVVVNSSPVEVPDADTPEIEIPTSRVAMEGVSDPELRKKLMQAMFGNNNPLQDDCAKG